MAWHEQGRGKRPAFLFKLKLTANVKKAIAAVPWDDWQGKSNEGLVQLVELKLKLHGWSRERRVVVERTLKPLNPAPQGSFWRQCEEDFNVYVTNLTHEEPTTLGRMAKGSEFERAILRWRTRPGKFTMSPPVMF